MPRNENGQFVPKEEVVEDEEKGPKYVENPVLTDLTRVGEGKANTLREAGFEDLNDVASATPADLMKLHRFGSSLASTITTEAKEFLKEPGQRELVWDAEQQRYELQDPEYWECECGLSFKQKPTFETHQEGCEEVEDDGA